MAMLRLALGGFVYLVGALVLSALHVLDWSYPLPLLGISVVGLAGGLLMGLHEDPPPWRRRHSAP